MENEQKIIKYCGLQLQNRILKPQKFFLKMKNIIMLYFFAI
jgi:hypothetical protein